MYTYNVRINGGMKMENRKSKVMKIANRLVKGMDGDRSAAMRKAWAIVKAGGLEIAVRGVSFGNRQDALKRLAVYEPDQVRAVLVSEPENPVDPGAIAVMVGVQNGRGLFRLGYVPRKLCAAVSAIGGKLPSLRVVPGFWNYGAKVSLAV
jgi:hypothetical protein